LKQSHLPLVRNKGKNIKTSDNSDTFEDNSDIMEEEHNDFTFESNAYQSTNASYTNTPILGEQEL